MMSDDFYLNRSDYIIVFILLIFSGNPLLSYYGGQLVYIGFFLISVLFSFLLKGGFIIQESLKTWLILSVILFFIQYIVLDNVSLPANINFSLRLIAGYFCVTLLGIKFRYAYLRVITFIALLSIFFYTFQTLTNITFGVGFERYKSILIYNSIIGSSGVLERNCGMFWEPGAFQGYIMLVPILFIDNLKILWNQERRSCIILLVALLTTQSTTAYVVLFVVLALSILSELKGIIVKFFIVLIIAFSGAYVFFTFDFIGEKMIEQFEHAQKMESGEVSWTRMGAMKIDKENIARNPISGNGFLLESMYGKLGPLMKGSGNGFSGALNAFGIPFILMYLIGVYRRNPGINVNQKLIAVLGIVLCLNGEFFLNYPLYWSLLFIEHDQQDHLYLASKNLEEI